MIRYQIVKKKLVIFIGSLRFARDNKTINNNSNYEADAQESLINIDNASIFLDFHLHIVPI